jgi:hypothetical protein
VLEGSQDLRYLYAPWIPAHGDWLVARIADDEGIRFAPVRLFGCGDHAARRDLLSFAERRPDAVAAALSRRIAGVGGVAHGLLLTHDWPAPLRVLAELARLWAFRRFSRPMKPCISPAIGTIATLTAPWSLRSATTSWLGARCSATSSRARRPGAADPGGRVAQTRRGGPLRAASRSRGRAVSARPSAWRALRVFALNCLTTPSIRPPRAARRSRLSAISRRQRPPMALRCWSARPRRARGLELGLNALADAPCALVDAAALDLPRPPFTPRWWRLSAAPRCWRRI